MVQKTYTQATACFGQDWYVFPTLQAGMGLPQRQADAPALQAGMGLPQLMLQSMGQAALAKAAMLAPNSFQQSLRLPL